MVFQKNLSEESTEVSSSLKALTDMLFNAPLTDETKIQFLKEELSAGRYSIHSQSLAAKLMEHLHVTHQPMLEEIF